MPNVPYQYGVKQALLDWGFDIPTGTIERGESRKFGSGTINPIIGSSSGAFSAIAMSMGWSHNDLIESGGELDPITDAIIRDNIDSSIFSFFKRLYTSRKKYTRLKELVHSEPAWYEHLINTYYPIWKLDALENYIRDELLQKNDFESLAAKLQILAVTQEQRLTLILGEENRDQPPDRDYKFQNSVPLWKAAAGSMALPPYYKPYELEDPPAEIAPDDGESVILIDGETRDPFTTDAAEDSNADLIIVSSFYRVHEYTSGLGHISEYGTIPVMWQEQAQGKDANKLNSVKMRNQKKKALKLYREQLEKSCVNQQEIEENMKEMEHAIDFREELDVIEINAQNYQDDELTYPYWDPFTLKDEVIEFQIEAGYSVAQKALKDHLI